MPPIVSQSESAVDDLTGPGKCGSIANNKSGINSHCGYGPRLPLLVISPYAKQNYVDNTLTDQSSITKFIEENWQTGPTSQTSMANKAGTLQNMFDFEAGAPKAPKVFLSPQTGEITGEEGGEPGTEGESGEEGGSGSGGSGSGGSGSGGGKGHEKIHCKVTGEGHKVTIECTVTGGSGRGSVRYRLERGNKVLGTSSSTLKGTKATSTIKTKSSLGGKYTLLATVDRADGINAVSQGVSLPGKRSVDLH